MRNATLHQVTLPNLSIRILRDVLTDAGMDTQSAFSRANLSKSIVDEMGAAVTAAQELAFQRSFVQLTAGRPDLWVTAARRYTAPTLSVRGMAMMTAPTLADWIEIVKVVDLYYSLVECRPLHDAHGELCGISLDYDESNPADLMEFAVNRDVICAVFNLDMMWQGPFNIDRVDVVLDEVSPEFRRAVHAPVRTGQPLTSIIWNPRLSAAPLALGNELLHREYALRAASQIEELQLEGGLVEQIVAQLRRAQQWHFDLNRIAAVVQMSPRTLQRKLDQHGVQFRSLKERARFEEAQSLLRTTDLTVAAIARRLGYVQSASFSSAFKRWSTLSPSDYRTSAPGS